MAIFCVVFHTMKRGFELSVAVASRVLQMARDEGFTLNFLFGKTLGRSSQAVYLDCREICVVAAVVEHQQAADSTQWSLAEGSPFPFPSVLEGGKKGEPVLTTAQMTTNRHTHLRAEGMEDKWYTIHSFRVGGEASHNMDGTAMGVLMEYVRFKSATVTRRYVRVTASAAAVGTMRSRETAFIEADALPLSERFVRSRTALPRAN